MYILCAVIYCGIGFCSFVISSRHWRPLVMTYRIILFCLLSISGEGFWHLLPAQWFVFHLFLLFFSCYFRWVICFFFSFQYSSILSFYFVFPELRCFGIFDICLSQSYMHNFYSIVDPHGNYKSKIGALETLRQKLTPITSHIQYLKPNSISLT